MIHNTCGTVGIGCIVYSAFLVTPALAWLVAGVALVAVGVGGSWYKSREAKKLNDR